MVTTPKKSLEFPIQALLEVFEVAHLVVAHSQSRQAQFLET